MLLLVLPPQARHASAPCVAATAPHREPHLALAELNARKCLGLELIYVAAALQYRRQRSGHELAIEACQCLSPAAAACPEQLIRCLCHSRHHLANDRSCSSVGDQQLGIDFWVSVG